METSDHLEQKTQFARNYIVMLMFSRNGNVHSRAIFAWQRLMEIQDELRHFARYH